MSFETFWTFCPGGGLGLAFEVELVVLDVPVALGMLWCD